MRTKLIDKQATSATFEVTVPAAEVDKAYERVLGSIARQVRVPGFRPGKAPKGVLIKRVGEDAFAQEVRDALVEAHYPEAVRELELSPVHAHFHAHEPNEGSDYTFEVKVDLYPDFELPELSEIVIDTAIQEVTLEMVAASVAELQREHATLVPVERRAQAGDYLLVESLSDEGPSGNVLPIDLERVSPALAEQLLGKAMGDEVELRLGRQDDEELGDEELRNEEAESEARGAAAAPTLRVVVKDVKEKEKPAADDDFARTLGFETWAEVEEQIRANLQRQLEADTFEAQREEFIDKLVAESDIEAPASLVNRRKASMLGNLAQELQNRKLTLEGYLETLEEKGGREAFEGELQTSAEVAVKRDLLLERLLEARGSEVSEREFGDALRYLATREGQEVGKFRREMGEEWLQNYRFLLARDKAVREVVRELVGGEERGTPALPASRKASDEAPDGSAAEPGDERTPDVQSDDTVA